MAAVLSAVTAIRNDGFIDPVSLELIDRHTMEVLERYQGEHGIGLKRKPYLANLTAPAELDLMRAIKQALDPNGILNPGKIFDI